MSAAAIAHYVGNMVRYDPQAVQRLRDATAQARQQQQQPRLVQREAGSAAEHTLEGELLNKQGRQHDQSPALSEEEYLARHEQQHSRASEGYQAPAQRAIAAYETAAQLSQPADVDRVGRLDVYA